MHNSGFRGDLFNWIQDFLIGRQQRVSVSNWSEVISRVPQGSMRIKFFYLQKIATKIYSSFSRDNPGPVSSLQDDIKAIISLFLVSRHRLHQFLGCLTKF